MGKLIKEYHIDCLNTFIEKVESFNDKEIKECLLNMSVEEAEALGFRRWSQDNLYLIPGCFYDLLPIGIELTCISGQKVVFDGNNIDDDTRHGLLAYGIYLRKD